MILIIRNKFKVFLYQSLGESQVFIDFIQRKIQEIKKYELEEIIDQAIYLKYL